VIGPSKAPPPGVGINPGCCIGGPTLQQTWGKAGGASNMSRTNNVGRVMVASWGQGGGQHTTLYIYHVSRYAARGFYTRARTQRGRSISGWNEPRSRRWAMKNRPSRCLLLLFVLALPGCATLFSHEPESIAVISDPPGAKFQYGPFKGITPTTILVPRKALTESATFQKEGFEERTVPVITGIQWITWLDIIAWQPFPI